MNLVTFDISHWYLPDKIYWESLQPFIWSTEAKIGPKSYILAAIDALLKKHLVADIILHQKQKEWKSNSNPPAPLSCELLGILVEDPFGHPFSSTNSQ